MRFGRWLAAVILACTAGLTCAQEQSYPNKPIRIIDAFVPGGITELLARLIGQKMSDDWGHPVIIEPKPGGGGNIGMIGDFIGFAVRADSPITSGKDLLERLKKDPSSVAAGITALGGNNHIALVLAARSAGVDTRKLKTPVFQSSGDSVTALLGGHIDLHIGSVGPLAKQLEAGKVRLLAVTSDQRLPGPLATIPT